MGMLLKPCAQLAPLEAFFIGDIGLRFGREWYCG